MTEKTILPYQAVFSNVWWWQHATCLPGWSGEWNLPSWGKGDAKMMLMTPSGSLYLWVLTVNFTQPRVTWEESLNEELSGSGWLGDICGRISWLLNDSGRPRILRGAPFLKRGPWAVKVWMKVSQTVWMCSFCVPDHGCDVTNCLMFLKQWTVAWLYKSNKPLLPIISFFRDPFIIYLIS